MDRNDFTLGRDWEGENPAGWLASEKMDGCRALWDGCKFWSRNGREIETPDWFKAGLPNTHLDGEIWAGRGGFNKASRAVRFGVFDNSIQFGIFDCPERSGNWLARISPRYSTEFAFTVTPILIQGYDSLAAALEPILHAGGEGLIIRDPDCVTYETGRVESLLKVKQMTDELWNAVL